MNSPAFRTDPGASLVVADAGPLISLGRVDQLALLPQLFVRVHVPPEVIEECLSLPPRSGTGAIRQALEDGWLVRAGAAPIAAPELDVGERAAIGLALALHAGLLTDDLAARRHALGISLPVMGTLGVLVLAKRRGLLGVLRPLIDRLRASGQRLGAEVVAQALAAAGEERT